MHPSMATVKLLRYFLALLLPFRVAPDGHFDILGRDFKEATIVYRKKPQTYQSGKCIRADAVTCTYQSEFCAGFHVGKNFFVTGAHCLVKPDGFIYEPNKLEILGVGKVDVKIAVHHTFANWTGYDIAWIWYKHPTYSFHTVRVANANPVICSDLKLDVFDPNAVGVHAGFRWIEVFDYDRIKKLKDHGRRFRKIVGQPYAAFKRKKGVPNVEHVRLCTAVDSLLEFEVHYIHTGIWKNVLITTDCHLAKCGHVEEENMQVLPVEQQWLTRTTTEVVKVPAITATQPLDIGASEVTQAVTSMTPDVPVMEQNVSGKIQDVPSMSQDKAEGVEEDDQENSELDFDSADEDSDSSGEESYSSEEELETDEQEPDSSKEDPDSYDEESYEGESGSYYEESDSYEEETDSYDEESGNYGEESDSYEEESGNYVEESSSYDEEPGSSNEDPDSHEDSYNHDSLQPESEDAETARPNRQWKPTFSWSSETATRSGILWDKKSSWNVDKKSLNSEGSVSNLTLHEHLESDSFPTTDPNPFSENEQNSSVVAQTFNQNINDLLEVQESSTLSQDDAPSNVSVFHSNVHDSSPLAGKSPLINPQSRLWKEEHVLQPNQQSDHARIKIRTMSSKPLVPNDHMVNSRHHKPIQSSNSIQAFKTCPQWIVVCRSQTRHPFVFTTRKMCMKTFTTLRKYGKAMPTLDPALEITTEVGRQQETTTEVAAKLVSRGEVSSRFVSSAEVFSLKLVYLVALVLVVIGV